MECKDFASSVYDFYYKLFYLSNLIFRTAINNVSSSEKNKVKISSKANGKYFDYKYNERESDQRSDQSKHKEKRKIAKRKQNVDEKSIDERIATAK